MQYHIMLKMYLYYCGVTDVSNLNASTTGSYDDIYINEYNLDTKGAGNYNFVNDRYNKKISVNFIKKFCKEEVSYSVGNDITYISRSGDEKILSTIQYQLEHWKEDHEANLAKNMLIYSKAYELYYINKDAEFCSRVISPRHGIAYMDHCDNVVFFLHIFRQPFDTKRYIDIYTDNEIIHCDETFTEVSTRQSHSFGCVPVGIATVSEDGWLDSIYGDIKALQDAYSVNISDISQEITEFRNAYLAFKNSQIDETDLPKMKKNGIIQFKGDGEASWLTKKIDSTFIDYTLSTLEDLMYKLSSHINTNEKVASNTSSLALRAKLISLEQKCRLNEKALSNCIKTRLCMLFMYLNNLKNTNYDYKDIKLVFVPNIPSDDLINAQVVTQLGPRLSTETALSLFSFVDNPKEEVKKVEGEQKANSIGSDLLNNNKPPVMQPKTTMPDMVVTK